MLFDICPASYQTRVVKNPTIDVAFPLLMLWMHLFRSTQYNICCFILNIACLHNIHTSGMLFKYTNSELAQLMLTFS